jgi:chemosensory pili system protein ChpA (sensor histidine kinase/response regulator)
MANQTSFDLASLSVVKPGILDGLSIVNAKLIQFLDAPLANSQEFEEAYAELHRIQGVLKMIRLDGVAVYCGEIENVFRELAENASMASPLYLSVLQSAISAMTDYIDSLMQGADNACLILFPKYEALQHLRGLEMSFEQDLFFPNLAIKLPDSVLKIAQPANATTLIKAAHSQYQRGLMILLQNGSGGFALMQRALDTVLSCTTPSENRDFWWVSIGFLECVEPNGLPMDLGVRKLLGRIERQIRSVVKADGGDVQAVINEMLYLIRNSEVTTDRIEQIKTCYELEKYFPVFSEDDLSDNQSFYEELREQLQSIEDNWVQCVEGDESACGLIVSYLEKIAGRIDNMERNSYLTKKVETLSIAFHDPKIVTEIADDVAVALMVWRGGMTQHEILDTHFREQARLLADQIEVAIGKDPVERQRIENEITLFRQTEHDAIAATLAHEMLANLQLVEQGLGAFFENAGKRSELTNLLRFLQQIQGGLQILLLYQAVELLIEIKSVVGHFAEGSDVPKLNETQVLASAVSALQEYIGYLANGQKYQTSALVASKNELIQLFAPPVEPESVIVSEPTTIAALVETPVEAPAAPVADVVPRKRLSDDELELLEIFLEEAKEVLDIMRANIEVCHLQPANTPQLITIRRGFHTLKGSGRMVGLLDIGEVAWAGEKAIQQLLQDKKTASPAVLCFMEDAVRAFSGWVGELEREGYANIEARELIARAGQIEQGLEPEKNIPAAVVQQPVIEIAEQPAAAQAAADMARMQAAAQAEAVAQAAAEKAAAERAAAEKAAAEKAAAEKAAAEKAAAEMAAAERAAAEMAAAEMAAAEMAAAERAAAEQGARVQTAAEEAAAPVLDLISADEAQAAEDFDDLESVTIGEISLPPSLFNIASEEASQNVRVMRHQLDGLLSNRSSLVQFDFMRAAHTLAGISRSLGFLPVVELSSGLEAWLQVNIDMPFNINEQQLQLVGQAVSTLDRMVQCICNKKMPQKVDDLVSRLLADKQRIIAEREKAMLADSASEMNQDIEESIEEIIANTVEVTAKDLMAKPAETVFEEPVATIIEKPVEAIIEKPVEQIVVNEIESSNDKSAAERDRLLIAEALAKSSTGVTGKQKMIMRDEVDAQLLPIFLEEVDELIPKIGNCLRSLREHPEEDQALLNRLLHTIKGSARMTGAMRIGELAHTMEDRTLSKVERNTAYWDILDSEFDKINILLEELRSGKVVPGVVVPSVIAGGEVAVVDRRAQKAADQTQVASMLRVRSHVIDRLVNQAGEISVARSRMETELRAFKDGLLELTGSVMRLRSQLREVEIQAENQMQARISLSNESNDRFDPLEFDRFTRLQELTRFMDESVHDVQTVQQSLLKHIDETNSAIFAQARLNRDLQQSLMSVRMVPFDNMSERLYRLVRQTAKELNKRVNLELIGTGVELDRSVLEKMTAPFDHLLRNAIAHGVEDEQSRIDSGKDPIAEIRVSLRQENNEIIFELSDDGKGLNIPALRAEAIKKGLLEADNYTVTDDQLAELIFASGVTTAAKVTEVSGRGIGMDVVRSEITALGGRIDVSTRAGQGTKFSIHLPLTLAVTQVLMVRAGSAIYAIPTNIVDQVRRVKPEELTAIYANQKVEWEGNAYPLHNLLTLLGNEDQTLEVQAYNPLLLLHRGNQRIVLQVDDLLGNREAVVKNIGPQLARLPGIAGATVLGDGSVVLILNPVQLTQRIHSVVVKPVKVEPIIVKAQSLIMVVDDSLTVRKITTRLLTRAGYEVVTAKDGVDALEQLAEISPDVMLLDVEMPRMDGFELTKRLRRDPQTMNLPIIMITSRSADKHRNLAMQIGVNAYLGKPYQDEELLEKIAEYIAMPVAAG